MEQDKESSEQTSRSRFWKRTGFGDKTIWDWLQLLIVPVALAAFGFWFAAEQEARQQQREAYYRFALAAVGPRCS